MFEKIKKLLMEVGLRYFMPYIIGRALSQASGGWIRLEVFALMAQPVALEPILPPRRGGAISIIELEADDILLRQLPRPAAVIADRYRQGAHCLAAVQGGRVTGCIWLILSGYSEDVVRIDFVLPLSGSCAWDFDIYVDPAHRLGFTFLKLWDGANHFLRQRRIAWSLSRISVFNQASLSSHKRMGAREIGKLTVLALGSLELMLSDHPPRFNLSWRQDHRPQLRLPEPQDWD